MAEHIYHRIQELRNTWTTRLIIMACLFAVAVTIVISVVIVKIFHGLWIWIPVVLVISSLLSYFLFFRKISLQDVSNYLDRTLPRAEESMSLVLQPVENLNYFEKRQLEKLSGVLDGKITIPPAITRKSRIALLTLLASILIAGLIYIVPVQHDNAGQQEVKAANKKETRLAGISGVSVVITPPAYTNRPEREQDVFNIEAEENAMIQWNIKTTIAADSLAFVFHDSTIMHLKAGPDKKTWTLNLPVRTPGFYQVKLGNSLSDFYRIGMIADQAPEITVHAPAASSTIEPGMPYRSNVDVSIRDDYGVSSASLFATIASGTGESVAFREQRIAFNDFVAGKRSYDLRKKLDLAGLQMKAGDELYFYITATDNRKKEKRSDVFIVRIEDTTELMSLEGLASGIDIKPEFFRSQRQIIIETEQLLKNQAGMSKDSFNSKSNDLGVDQKLLRLRYGKFLGEETDVEIGGHEGEDHDESNVKDMMDQYTHKHDNSEDASFFDAETKKQLKATLAEMWKAELQLRTLKPADALPFEYKALRLLKDLQQKTRAYVSKTGIKTTPLDPKKRLTGELDGIQPVVSVRKLNTEEEKMHAARQSIGILEELRESGELSPASLMTLQEAMGQLSEKAAKDPVGYLEALTSTHKILNKKYSEADIQLAGKGFLKMIRSTEPAPVKPRSGPDGTLSDRYFKRISSGND